MSDTKKMKSPKMSEDMKQLSLKNPIVSKLEEVSDSMVEQSKENIKKINALKNLQVKLLEVESRFFEELHEMECRYASLYEPFYEKRRQIVNGEYEPSAEESKWALDGLNDDESCGENGHHKENGDAKTPLSPEKQTLLDALKAQMKMPSGEQGLENFWLETLRSFRITAEIIQEHDEPILEFLRDIKVKLFDKKPYGYTIEFYFAENPYFTNKVLTKTYTLKTEVDPKDPFSFEGPDLDKATGCKIDWKAGKNVCVKLIKKKLKSKNKKAPPKIITKEEKQDSFFNFFETPKVPEKKAKSPCSSGAEDGHNHKKDKQIALRGAVKSDDDDENDDDGDDAEHEAELYLIADFEIGQYIKEKIVPKAILFFTGEDIDEDDYYDEDDDDEEDDDEEGDENEDDDDEEEDDDDDDDDEEEDEEQGNKKGGKKQHLAIQGKGKAKSTGGKGGEPTPSECKQN